MHLTKFKLAFTLLLLPVFLAAQYPAQDTDYKYSYSTDESGEGWAIYSYHLENISSENLLFYNFNFPNGKPDVKIINPMLDVLILKPGQKKAFVKYKTFTAGPSVNWIANFMRYEDNPTHPVSNKDYVFYYEYQEYENSYTYSYYLKNISDRGISFYDFIIVGENLEYSTYKDFPSTTMEIRPGQSFETLHFSVNKDKTLPSLNWYAKFIDNDDLSFNPTNYEFCEGINYLLRDAKTGFTTTTGPIKSTSGDDLFGVDENFSKVHIDGFYNEVIEYLLLKNFVAQIGQSNSLNRIENQLELYRNKLKECLPSTMYESEVPKEDLFMTVKKFKYEGTFEGDQHYAELEIKEDSNKAGKYLLKILIGEVF